jgi:5,5'-dehydrodivanillate O-demethylase
MATREENELLTRVGPATPAGEMLRRYWWPIGFAEHITAKSVPVKVRLLGEELVLFRDGQGQLGLLGLHCSHRGTSLEFGRVEDSGIRCCYHGWLYDRSGRCLEQPAEPEDSTFKDRIRHRAYLAQELGGLVFAYLGPAPAPLLPNYDLLARMDGNRKLSASVDYCNWLQRAENSVDQGHLPFLHATGYPDIAMKRPDVTWERTWYGVRALTRVVGVPDKTSIYVFPSHNRFAGNRVYGRPAQHMHFRVPVDDVETITYSVMFQATPNGEPGTLTTGELDRGVPGVYTPIDNGFWRVMEEDRMAAEQQGAIADRTAEHLASSDRGVILMREMVKQAIDAIQEGMDPPGVMRDAERNRLVSFEAQMAGVAALA